MTNAMTGAYRDGMESVAAAVSGLVEDIFGALDRIATATAGLWDRLGANGVAVRSTDLTELREVVLAELAAQRSLFHGAGLVIADGAGSTLREQAGIATRGRDYHQRAVVAICSRGS